MRYVWLLGFAAAGSEKLRGRLPYLNITFMVMFPWLVIKKREKDHVSLKDDR